MNRGTSLEYSRDYSDRARCVRGLGSSTDELHDKGLKTSPELECEDWNTTVARLAHIVNFKKNVHCMSLIDTLKNGRIFGGDCEVALIHFGYKVCVNTDESQGDACDASDDC